MIFSVQYVVNNSNSSLPIYYRLSAVGVHMRAHLLLWILVINTLGRSRSLI